jgi:hypothetical protein
MLEKNNLCPNVVPGDLGDARGWVTVEYISGHVVLEVVDLGREAFLTVADNRRHANLQRGWSGQMGTQRTVEFLSTYQGLSGQSWPTSGKICQHRMRAQRHGGRLKRDEEHLRGGSDRGRQSAQQLAHLFAGPHNFSDA